MFINSVVYTFTNRALNFSNALSLQTIGLHELNADSTETLDNFGRVIQTYTNLDIMSNTRLFTGFTYTARRDSVKELFRSEKSRQDPLRIDIDKHVSFSGKNMTRAIISF